MGGPGFVFNMGGGPGIRVHQFGGMGPRRRPRNATGPEEPPPSGLAALVQLLPILLLFILPLLTSLFTGSSSSSAPEVLFQSSPPNTLHRTTPRYQVNYYLDPNAVDGFSERKLRQLDQTAELKYINTLKYECQSEHVERNRMLEEAQGWFSTDEKKFREARALPMRSCNRLNDLGVHRQY
jgi:DnaJ homolog subfamily B member 12